MFEKYIHETYNRFSHLSQFCLEAAGPHRLRVSQWALNNLVGRNLFVHVLQFPDLSLLT